LKGWDKVVDQVKTYLEHKPDITLLHVEGYYDSVDKDEASKQKHASERAFNVARALVHKGVDCKRLIAVAFTKGGDMAEGGAYVAFVNAGLRGKAIGGMPVEGGGHKIGDVCSGTLAS